MKMSWSLMRLVHASSTQTPANDNPWYCLATLHGEYERDMPVGSLIEKNRQSWNHWVGYPSGDQRASFESLFASRTRGRQLTLPERTECPDFSNTHFERQVLFSGFLFPLGADFHSSKFSEYVSFQSANFSEVANFSSTTFVGGVNFGKATFSYIAFFKSAKFSDEALFESTYFSNAAYFDSATFSAGADFSLTGFADLSAFNLATFAGSTDFSGATFVGPVDFQSAKFTAEIHFVNAKLVGVTHFSEAKFESRVPDFRGATLHEATEWHDVTWPRPPENKQGAQKQVYSYERLKQEMERLKKHEDEQSFFRKELRARRGLHKPFSGTWLLNLIYQISSDYGDSLSRPLLWLVGVFAAGTAIFTNVPLCAGQTMPFKLAARLSFANIFIFLNDKRELTAAQEMASCLSNTTAAVSAVQSISGVVLLFLLGLVLRNRFRMK